MAKKIIVLDEWEVSAMVRALKNTDSYSSNAAERAASDELAKKLLADDNPPAFNGSEVRQPTEDTMSKDLPSEIQKEVARLRETVAITKALLPNYKANFVFYDLAIAEAERAVREQDTVTMVTILPRLREME